MTKRRWLVLAAFTVELGVTQLLWLNFAPLIGLVKERYGVGDLAAGALVLVFPLLYVVFSIPAGALTDARGYRFTAGLGAIATAAFAALRLFDARYATLLAAQVGIAVAQPFVVNGISKLVADWFEPAESALATGLGTMGMFLGMAVGMAATPWLAGALGLRGAMAVFAAVAIAAAAAFFAFVRERGGARAQGSSSTDFAGVWRDRELLLLYAISFLGLGAFNGLTTWLEEVLAPQGVSAEAAGVVGGVLIAGGIAGAVVIPLLSDRARRRKPFLVGCALVAAACVWPLCTSTGVPLLATLAAVLGFFFMPAFALLLDMSAQHAGAARAGAATSLLMLAGNAGGVAVVVAVPLAKDFAGSYRAAALLMAGLVAVAAVMAAFAAETFPVSAPRPAPAPR